MQMYFRAFINLSEIICPIHAPRYVTIPAIPTGLEAISPMARGFVSPNSRPPANKNPKAKRTAYSARLINRSVWLRAFFLSFKTVLAELMRPKISFVVTANDPFLRKIFRVM